MSEHDELAARFEEHRGRLRAIAYRMLGSTDEAEDAVQETWLRLDRTGAEEIGNLGGWLTTTLARVCLNLLRSRRTRRETSLEVHVPDPLVGPAEEVGPEGEAVLADSVGLAMLVVLDTLTPAERIAFVLHDMFGVPFDEVAELLERSPAAARQLASRARRRVRGRAPTPDADLARQREAVSAFFAAARDGDFDGLVRVLADDVVLRADGGPDRPERSVVVHGGGEVAAQAVTFSRFSPFVRPALVNGAAGVVVVAEGRALSIMGFTVVDGRIVAIDVLFDPVRLADVDVTVLDT